MRIVSIVMESVAFGVEARAGAIGQGATRWGKRVCVGDLVLAHVLVDMLGWKCS